jgi:FKBP-type peptidyl-prolyl cis-trans isomerase FkpA
MSSNLRLLLLLSLACGLPACATPPSGLAGQTASGVPETEDQKFLYTLGQIMGRNVTNANFSEEEIAFVQLGLADVVLGRDSQIDFEEYAPQLQVFMDQRMQASSDAELTESLAFVEQHAAVEGAVRTDSGLVIQEIAAGDGAVPTPEDTVTVHYHGTLRDGSVFDSSVDRGEPTTFPLSGVIPCWTEGLQHIQVGGKGRLICPPNIAYGPTGRPGIPGNAALVFEVELLEINP